MSRLRRLASDTVYGRRVTETAITGKLRSFRASSALHEDSARPGLLLYCQTMWALYALTAALLTSFLPIINKRILTTADVAIVAWVPNALSLPILLAVTLALASWSRVDELFFLGVFASGILNLVATLASTRALQLADASVVTPFLSFNPAFTLLLSVFTLREVPSGRALWGCC